MAFPKGINDANGLNKKFGSAIAEDEQSNKVPSGGKKIGPIKGRITTSKSSVSSLNKGVSTCRDDSYSDD